MENAIPIVDFSGMLGDSIERRKAVAREVDRCAREVGFMYLKNFGIAPETFEALRDTAHRFFSANQDLKERYLFDQRLNFGYHAIGKEGLDPSKPKDQKESFTMRDVSSIVRHADLWPSLLFRQVTADFYHDCRRLAERLMSAFAMALDLPEDFFTDKHSGRTQTLRLLHYPPSETHEEGQLGAGAHTDYGTLTLLYQDNTGGLEVMSQTGEWLPAPPLPGTIVINTGDLLARWTNDVYRSTAHRVQVRPSAAKSGRLSIAFFSDPDPDVVIDPLPSCISEDNPSRYAAITAEEHINAKIAATN
ncbi:2OG-Fe(II) oxygenase family protein [Pelagicoccus sp. SDUM812003]|uniref:isopenicillin N synthase family dioxygenase n=1 Tax=Pelagicoccus sp. SDUM812003 TaxID=3041267 RepID=UPI00280EE895|nr:2OG-Fe(II) oxygenase family protein [Pelagicoccus sp. SDUM812003]MDQ8205471.1 2OG-Fe(II) oxygenase family protein [Pelagicoccus sp. SDUM812003]